MFLLAMEMVWRLVAALSVAVVLGVLGGLVLRLMVMVMACHREIMSLLLSLFFGGCWHFLLLHEYCKKNLSLMFVFEIMSALLSVHSSHHPSTPQASYSRIVL